MGKTKNPICSFASLILYEIKNIMNKTGPIIVIEDDEDDRIFMEEVFTKLNYKNEIVFCEDGEKALEYLIQTPIEPFIILSDINMPKLNGMALREQVHNNEDLRLKCIPYLFFTTSANQDHVIDAYSKSVQGFFVKPNSMEKLANIIRKIVEYWQECESPNYIK
ncbi:MAG TPA: response regulator [Bacteroidia bacterium]|nr:response regulator [Bacteroidia bacterium]